MTNRAIGKRLAALLAMGIGAVACTQSTDAPTSADSNLIKVFPVSEEAVDTARASRDPVKIAALLHTLVSDRTALPSNNTTLRIERVKRLFDRSSVELVRGVRAAYITAHREDPEITIRSDGLGQPILQLSREAELDMVSALDGAEMAADASALADMSERARRDSLTTGDRKAYFAMLPRMGLWDAPVRAAANDRSLDSLERLILARAWTAGGNTGEVGAALARIEAKLPPPDLASDAARSKSIAVIASSHGAQWQELMGWATVMHGRGFRLQVFTPEGRPVAFQRDSLSVSVKTTPLGFGCPADLDPAGSAGRVAAELLANVAPAKSFDATQFGAVYLAGGLGFNEDVAVAREGKRPDGRAGTELTANPNIARMMQGAIAERLPLIAICHGPTLFAATPITINGRSEALNKGIDTASLPPFESFVGFTERKEIQFTFDVNTHNALAQVGGRTNVVADIANMSRVVKARKADIDVVTGPGPQAASALAPATIEVLQRRWQP